MKRNLKYALGILLIACFTSFAATANNDVNLSTVNTAKAKKNAINSKRQTGNTSILVNVRNGSTGCAAPYRVIVSIINSSGAVVELRNVVINTSSIRFNNLPNNVVFFINAFTTVGTCAGATNTPTSGGSSLNRTYTVTVTRR